MLANADLSLFIDLTDNEDIFPSDDKRKAAER